MALLIEQMKASFPRANYGFAQAIRKGKFEYARGTLGIYNRLSIPAEFYDCATAMRLTVKGLRSAGVKADACLLQIPTSGGTDGGSVAQHLVARLKDKDGRPDLVLGITPYDKLLGTYPYAEVIPGSAVAKLLDSYGQEDQNDDIFNHSQNPAGLLLRIRLPKDVSVLMPEADFIPLSACQHWGLFGIANLGLFFSESKGTFLLYYSADFWGKGKSEEFPLAMPAQRKIKVEMTPENFALLRREIAARSDRTGLIGYILNFIAGFGGQYT